MGFLDCVFDVAVKFWLLDHYLISIIWNLILVFFVRRQYVFLFVVNIFFRPYDVTTIATLLFVQLYVKFQLKCVRFVHSHYCFWSHVIYLTLKNDFLTLK